MRMRSQQEPVRFVPRSAQQRRVSTPAQRCHNAQCSQTHWSQQGHCSRVSLRYHHSSLSLRSVLRSCPLFIAILWCQHSSFALIAQVCHKVLSTHRRPNGNQKCRHRHESKVRGQIDPSINKNTFVVSVEFTCTLLKSPPPLPKPLPHLSLTSLPSQQLEGGALDCG